MQTPFSLDAICTSAYWIVVLLMQAFYVKYLYSSDQNYVDSAANVGSHFIVVSTRIQSCSDCADLTSSLAQSPDFRLHHALGPWVFLVGRVAADHQSL